MGLLTFFYKVNAEYEKQLISMSLEKDAFCQKLIGHISLTLRMGKNTFFL